MADKIFVNGLIFKTPRPNAPTFVKGAISIKTKELIAWLQERTDNEWLNVDVKESKGGKLYCELNTYRKGDATAPAQAGTETDQSVEIGADDIPF